MRWSVVVVAVLTACKSDEVPLADDDRPVVETGACDVAVADANGAPAEVLYADAHGWFTNRAFNYFEVVRDDGPYDQLQADLQVSLPPVDFSAEMVIAVWESRETCDFDIDSAAAYRVGDGYHFVVNFTDLTGGCTEACDAPGGALVVVKLPYADPEPTVCRRTWDGCYAG